MSEATPGEWVRDAAAGSGPAWGRLVDHYSGLLWSISRSFRLSRADADDVVQTTWLRLVEQLGRIEQPDRVGAWLATTARNEWGAVEIRRPAAVAGSSPDELGRFVADGLAAGPLSLRWTPAGDGDAVETAWQLL